LLFGKTIKTCGVQFHHSNVVDAFKMLIHEDPLGLEAGIHKF
jgi:hypothetical protein